MNYFGFWHYRTTDITDEKVKFRSEDILPSKFFLKAHLFVLCRHILPLEVCQVVITQSVHCDHMGSKVPSQSLVLRSQKIKRAKYRGKIASALLCERAFVRC